MTTACMAAFQKEEVELKPHSVNNLYFDFLPLLLVPKMQTQHCAEEGEKHFLIDQMFCFFLLCLFGSNVSS